MKREIVILSGVRTAIGGYGGSLKDSPPSEMAAACVREAVTRSGIDVKDVGHIVFGNIIHTDAHDHYLARVAGVNGGLPHETPALTLNRLCGSGLQAIITCAQDDHARRCRGDRRRRGREYESQSLQLAGHAFRRADE